MKVMLIKAPYTDIYGKVKEMAPEMFPIGLGYIAVILRNAGHDVTLIDPDIGDMTYDSLRDEIIKESPNLVGISAMTSNIHSACKIATIVKKSVNAITVIGGNHTSSVPEETMQNFDDFDFLVIGEGEYTILELCNTLERDKTPDLSKIKGICYKRDGKIIKTDPRSFIEDMDSLPFPARDMVDMDNYRPPNYMEFGKKSATMITSRGCPNRCTFCSAHFSTGYRYRPHSPDYVISEIKHLINEYGIEFIIFWDDTFTIDRSRVIKICNLMLEEKLGIEWFCLARVNTVDEELLRLMKKAGCRVINFGVESGNQEILNNIKKGTTIPQIRKAIKMARKVGFKILSSFMFGLPGETHETIENTIRFAIELDPDMAFFFILTPLPGSEIYNTYKGILFDVSSNWEDYKYVLTDGTIALDSREFTKEELKNYLVEANRRFYGRPRYILRQILYIRSKKELISNISGAFTLLKQSLLIKGLIKADDIHSN